MTQPDLNTKNLIAYGMYINFIQTIKHFDTIQVFFRMMSSTFLLGSIVGIGFLFSTENVNITYENIYSLFLICGIGSSLIFSLWYLDLIFYERLLVANFAEALKLEEQHSWLPKVHHKMLVDLDDLNIRSNTANFYVGAIGNLLLITGIISAYLLKESGITLQTSIITFTLLLAYTINKIIKRKTKPIKLYLQLLKE